MLNGLVGCFIVVSSITVIECTSRMLEHVMAVSLLLIKLSIKTPSFDGLYY